MRNLFLMMVFAAGLMVCQRAPASLVGDEVLAGRFFGGVAEGGGPFASTVVAGSTEYTPMAGLEFIIDVEASSIVIETEVNRAFSGSADHILEISSLDWLDMPSGRITGGTAVAENLVVGIVAPFAVFDANTKVTFFDHAVQIDLANSHWGQNFDGSFTTDPGRITIQLQTDHPTNTVPVPAPAALGTIGLAMLMLGYTHKRRRCLS